MPLTHTLRNTALLTTLLLAACSTAPPVVAAGDYQFFTRAADDACMDGALEAVFMPEGPASPNAFEFPVYLPSLEEVPLTYSVSFREPFVGMEVTVDAAEDNSLHIQDAVIDAVLLDEQRYGNCVVTMTMTIDLTPAGLDRVVGTAFIDLSNARGSEGRCPPLDADPCPIQLDVEANRVGDGTPE